MSRVAQLWTQIPLEGSGVRNLRLRPDGYWFLVALSPLVTLVLLGSVFLLGVVTVLLGTVPFLLLYLGLAVLTCIFLLSNILLPIGVYYDCKHVREQGLAADSDWEPNTTVYTGLGLTSIFMPFFADPVALSYLFFRIRNTPLGPDTLPRVLVPPGFGTA